MYGGNILDNKTTTAWNLISCNPYLFGNTLTDAMESTVDYWWDDNNVAPPNLEDIINQSLRSLNLCLKDPEKYKELVEKLQKTMDLIKADHGVLSQIFIPHEEVNNITYIAKANGIEDKEHPNALKSLIDLQYRKTQEIANYDTLQVRLLAGRLINPDHTADYRMYTYKKFSVDQDAKFHSAITCIIQELLQNCI